MLVTLALLILSVVRAGALAPAVAQVVRPVTPPARVEQIPSPPPGGMQNGRLPAPPENFQTPQNQPAQTQTPQNYPPSQNRPRSAYQAPPPFCAPGAANGPLQGPMLSNSGMATVLPTGAAPTTDRPLPINLATALRLSNGRPLVIAVAQARMQIAAAQAQKANVLWLPSANAGVDYITHAGGIQNPTGNLAVQSADTFIAGGSAVLRVATTDAIFEPLVARQVLRSRRIDTQTARNEALEQTAESYFNVQMARGTYAAMTDATVRSNDLSRRVQTLARGLVAPDEIDRARTLQAELEQSTQIALQQWRVSSANLTRVLRLDPAAVVIPLEPDHLQVTLISPEWGVDDLIVVGLTNRPELASHRALVQATLVRLRRERLRPLTPSILITGNGTPDFFFQGGIFGAGSGGNLDQWAGRADVSAQAIWQLENLGFGYQAKVREQRGEVQLATVELFKVQDQVAAEVVQAKADVDSAVLRVTQADTGLRQALTSFKGNLQGLGQTQRFGDVLSLVNRPQEAVSALQQLQQAYVNYYRTVADYNRAQFRLYYAMGFPAEELACARPTGPIEPVDTYRGPALPNVPNR
ncbi:MAG TPA: hypothetical protein VGJ26_09215 [Pirellulales bacterium]